MRKLQLCLLGILINLFGFGQDKPVELVIASGLDWSTAMAMSKDNLFGARAIMNTVSIWDIKTGRMIRNVSYTDDQTKITDTIWFNDAGTKLILGLLMSHDTYEVDVETGDVEFKKGPAFDWSTYQFHFSRSQIASTHLYNSSATNDLVFPSPDGASELVLRKIKNPLIRSTMMPSAYEVRIRSNGKLSGPLDTTLQSGFIFSQDSKYLFANNSIYDVPTSRKVSELRITPFSGMHVMFYPGTRIPVTCGIGCLRTWDFPDIADIDIPHLLRFRPSLDGNMIIVEKYDLDKGQREYVTVDLVNKKVYSKLIKSKETGYLVDFSADGSMFSYVDQTIDQSTGMAKFNSIICDSKTGKVIREFGTTRIFFTEDPNYVIVDTAGLNSFKLNVKNGNLEPFPTEGVELSTYVQATSLSNKYILGYTLEMETDDEMDYNARQYFCKVLIWNSTTGEKVFEKRVKGANIRAFEVSHDESLVAFSASHEHTIHVCKFKTGEELFQLKGHTNLVEQIAFSEDGKRLISGSLDGTRKVWNIEQGHEMVSLMSTGREDYAIVNPQSYYYATKGAKKLIHFVKGTEIFPFSQFDLKYNRPDIILQSLEASNQDLIEPFNLAYQKRLSRLGFTEEMLDGEFHMPETFIANMDDIPISTKENTISLNVTAKDDKFNLDRLLIRVNEVPVHGKDGLDLKGDNSQSLYKKIEIQLSSGDNQIAVSVMNEKGVESIPANLNIEYLQSGEVQQELHLFTIGVSQYAESEYNLSYAAKDAEDLQKLFNSGGSPFTKVNAYRLTNEEVTLESVKALKEKLMNTKVDDAVCIFFAGHGILDANLDYFLASYDIDFTDPAKKGIPYDVFEDLLDNIPARKKLILIDACHSGEIDKDEMALVEDENTTETNEDMAFRAITGTTVQRVGLNNSFELMKELFTDLRKASGTMIISSAGGMEYAMEGADWNNGVFTYCLLHGISDGSADLDGDGVIMLSEVNNFVREEVFKLTNGRQQPTNRAEIIDSDWRLW